MKMNVKKKVLSWMLALTAVVAVLSTHTVSVDTADLKLDVVKTWSTENEKMYVTKGNENISNADSMISLLGLNVPGSSVNLNDGRLPFGGTADTSTLYTNKGFYGKTKVLISVTNYRDSKLKVTLYKKGNLLSVKSWKVPANSGMAVSVANLDKTAKYYLKFTAPSDFKGYVE